jgi:hypothetical protein
MGEGGQAATTIRNDLAAKSPLLRPPLEVEAPSETARETMEVGD